MKNVVDFKDYSVVFLYNCEGEIVGQAIIDKEDKKKVEGYRWSLSNSGYAVSWINGKIKTMHQHIFKIPEDNNVVDHINGEKLDNRKSNLREVSRSMNALLSTKTNNNTGKKGVTYNEKTGRYYANIYINGKRINLGCSENFIEAVRFREEAEKKYIHEELKRIENIKV